jgi:hypothetical protein
MISLSLNQIDCHRGYFSPWEALLPVLTQMFEFVCLFASLLGFLSAERDIKTVMEVSAGLRPSKLRQSQWLQTLGTF